MPKPILTESQKQFIRDNYKLISGQKMANKFNCEKSVIYLFRKKENLTLTDSEVKKFRAKGNLGKTTFTKKEDDYIKANYLKITIESIAKKLGRSDSGVNFRMKKLGLILPKEVLEQRRLDSYFKKGMTPVNKGKKQADFMSAEAIERTKKTRFKKGQSPYNSLPIGVETIRKDKGGRDYVMVKVEGAKKLVYKNIHVWENHHKRKKPKGHNVIFKDGDTMNFDINNLELVSDSELMKLNSIHHYSEELREIIKLKNKLKKELCKKS